MQDTEGRTLRHVGRAIGIGSNNVAEWNGLILGLEAARDLGATHVLLAGDSKLVIEQFSGNYAVHDDALRELFGRALTLRRSFANVDATHVPRERNRAADAICNAVLDGTYEPDGALPDPEPFRPLVEVAFVVQVEMDPRRAREAIAGGKTATQLRKALAAEVEGKLLRAGVVGEYTARPARIRG